MAPTGAWYSIWATERDDYDSPDLLLDCLLPTGIIVQLKHVSKDATLVDIKKVIVGTLPTLLGCPIIVLCFRFIFLLFYFLLLL